MYWQGVVAVVVVEIATRLVSGLVRSAFGLIVLHGRQEVEQRDLGKIVLLEEVSGNIHVIKNTNYFSLPLPFSPPHSFAEAYYKQFMCLVGNLSNVLVILSFFYATPCRPSDIPELDSFHLIFDFPFVP